MPAEKTGFIYIWFDIKRKMYYIGCHWGTEDDGYICSSNRMRDAYRRRSQDFKRRILAKNIDRNKLLEEEYKWLQLIPDEELGKKYYNLKKHHYGHWSHSSLNRQNTVEKQRKTLKERYTDKEFRVKMRRDVWNKNKGRLPPNAWGKDHIPWNKGQQLSKEAKEHLSQINTGKKQSEETKEKIRQYAKNNPYRHSEEIKEKIRNALTGRKMKKEQVQKMRNSKKGKKIGKMFEWKIQGPDGEIYIENGLDIFCKQKNICANNLRKRGKSKGYQVLNKILLKEKNNVVTF